MPETLVPVVPERLVNTVTEDWQHPTDDVVLPGGQAVVAWIDQANLAWLGKIRVFQPGAASASGEIVVAQGISDLAVATATNGFVAVWTTQTDPQTASIQAQAYDPLGHPLGTPLVIESYNTHGTPTLAVGVQGLEVLGLSTGGYVVGWTRESGDDAGRTGTSANFVVVGKEGLIEARETPLGNPPSRASSAIDSFLTFAETPEHQLMATWRSYEPNVEPNQYVRLYDLLGHPLGQTVALDPVPPSDGGPPLNPPTELTSLGLGFAALPSGGLAYVWMAQNKLWVSVYHVADLGSAAGSDRSPPVALTSGSAGPGEPQIAVLPDGSFIVGWSEGDDVMARIFSANGVASGDAFHVGTVTTDRQDMLKLAIGDGGALVAAWEDFSRIHGPGSPDADTSSAGVKFEVLAAVPTGGPGADLVTGGPLNDRIAGGDGDDTLIGGGGDDTLLGNRGDDSIVGGTANDVIYGGQGADQLAGGDGDNTLSGDLGNDTLSAGAGHNVLFGGDGDDSIVGSSGFDRVNGNQGADTIVGHSTVGDWLSGGQGNDVIDASGSTGNNIVNGNLGADTIFGGSGADTLRGGGGDDVIHAGSGSDFLFGDLGDNTIYGGQGMDTFHAGPGHDLVNGWHAGDLVMVSSGVTGTISQVNGDVHITFSNGGEMDLLNTQLSSLPSVWIVSE